MNANLAGWLLVGVGMAVMLWLALRAERRTRLRLNGEIEPRETRMAERIRELEATVGTLLTKLNEAQRTIEELRGQLQVANQRISELELVIANPADATRTGRRAQDVSLRHILEARFSEDELRTLAADLEIDYEALPGDAKGGRVRELVAWFERRGDLARLDAAVRAARPLARL